MGPDQKHTIKTEFQKTALCGSEIQTLNPGAPSPTELDYLVTLFDTTRFAELEQAARGLLEKSGHCGVAWKLLGAALYMQGREPLRAMQMAAGLLPDDAQAHNNLGCALQEAKQHEASLAGYRRAIEIWPDFFEAHINLANASRDLGQLDAAVASYRQALAIDPNQAEIRCQLGDVLRKIGELPAALESYRQAIALEPGRAATHLLLGSLLRHLGHLPDAVESYQRAIELAPHSAEAHNDLGLVLRELGQLDFAVACYERALQIKPDFAAAHNNLGVALRELGQSEQAVASCRTAVAIADHLHEAHSNLGNALQELGQIDAAVSSYCRALEIKPDFASALSNLGTAWRHLGKLDEAVCSCRRAIAIKPDFTEAHNNLGVALKAQGQLDLALTSFFTALSHDKNSADVHCNIGITLQEQGKTDECMEYFDRALTLSPNRATTQYAYGLMHLQNGNLKDGWAGYGYRWSGSEKPLKKPVFKKPEWQGEPLTGKTILIWGEQGVGDQIMFAGLFGDMLLHAKRCIVACTEKLIPLFSQSFQDVKFISLAEVHSTMLLDEIDYQCPAGSLAQWVRADQTSFCTKGVYLKSKAERVAYWKNRLDAMGPGLKIGICWRSAYLIGNRYLHYSALDQWGPIFAVPGVHFINLQYDQCDAELESARRQFGVSIHNFSEVDLYNDLVEAAALTGAMDLVIGAPTASGRLAAALGVPTWALRYGTADWTSLGTLSTPWLPCIRFFSRAWDGDWSGVIEHLASQLTLKVNGAGR